MRRLIREILNNDICSLDVTRRNPELSENSKADLLEYYNYNRNYNHNYNRPYQCQPN